MVLTRSGKTSVTPEKRQKCVKKRLDQIKAKLVEINEAIGELDKIQTPTEDALLSWLRGPVSVSQNLKSKLFAHHRCENSSKQQENL